MLFEAYKYGTLMRVNNKAQEELSFKNGEIKEDIQTKKYIYLYYKRT